MLLKFRHAAQKHLQYSRFFLLITLVAVFHTSPIHAEPEETHQKAKYLQITPSLVTNFRSDSLRYVKADVALKVRGNNDSLSAVESHLPRIKHQLIMLLSRQELDGITTADGRAALKELALEDIQEALSEESVDAQVEEVLFTGFLVE